MSIGEDLVTFLTESSTIMDTVSERVHQNHIPQRSQYPAIWFRRNSEEEELTLDGTGGLVNTGFDVECLSTIMDTAIDLADDVKARLHGYRGTMGDSSCKACFVTDKDDEYIPQGNASDEGVSVVAMDVTIWH